MNANRPNVIVFFTDQQRWDTTGVHGNPTGLTPNFDRMAAEGTHCASAFTCQPVCLPARASLQTGMFASQLGCHDNSCALGEKFPTLGTLFAQGGYHTGYIGKWHLAGTNDQAIRYRGGYQYWLAANVLEFVSDAYDCVMFDAEGKAVKLPGYRVDAQTDAAIRYIDANQREPFLLFCSYLEPHFQNSRDDYPAPDGYAERYLDPWTPPDLRALVGTAPRHLPGYYGIVKRLDEALGRVMDALKSLGLDRNTIILFTSDHGCHFKTRNSEYKRSCHDSSIRIPTALTGGPFAGGGRVRELVSLVDLPPTLLDACGLAVPPHMMGRSILPLTQGQGVSWPDDVYVEISESHIGRCVRTHRWKYEVSAKDGNPRTGNATQYEEAFLYDLLADPYELNNLAGYASHRGVADVMRDRLLVRMEAAGQDRPQITLAPEVASGQKTLSPEEIRQ